MHHTIRRLVLILAASSGVIAATSLTASAGLSLMNHCEPSHPHESTNACTG